MNPNFWDDGGGGGWDPFGRWFDPFGGDPGSGSGGGYPGGAPGGLNPALHGDVAKWVTTALSVLGKLMGGSGLTSPRDMDKFARVMYPVLAAKAELTRLSCYAFWFGEIVVVHPNGYWQRKGPTGTTAEGLSKMAETGRTLHFLLLTADDVQMGGRFGSITAQELAVRCHWAEYGNGMPGWNAGDPLGPVYDPPTGGNPNYPGYPGYPTQQAGFPLWLGLLGLGMLLYLKK